jgi:hypothetical protein
MLAAMPDEHDHDEHDHDDHDHDEHEHEPDEDAARHLARLAGALGALDDDDWRTGIAGMSEGSRAEMASHLNLPKAALHLGETLVPLVRRKALAAHPARQLSVAFSVTERVNGATIKALGARHEDPSHEDMLEVLPGLLGGHSPRLVTLMLASYAASDAPCQAVFAGLLDTDERFAVPPPPDLSELDEAGAAIPRLTTTPTAARDGGEQAAKREQRKAAKEAKRAAEAARRAAREAAEAKRKEARRAAKRP